MGRSTICCHQGRFVATSSCSKMGRSTMCCHQLVLKYGKKYDLLSPACARLSKMGRSTICCHQLVLDCQRWEEARFVAASLCAIVKDGKKYDLLSPVCARLSKMGRSTICCHQLRSTICCHQVVLDCQRWEAVRFVAAQFVLDCQNWKTYVLLPPGCARLSKMGRSTICCCQFALIDGNKYDLLPAVCA